MEMNENAAFLVRTQPCAQGAVLPVCPAPAFEGASRSALEDRLPSSSVHVAERPFMPDCGRVWRAGTVLADASGTPQFKVVGRMVSSFQCGAHTVLTPLLEALQPQEATVLRVQAVPREGWSLAWITLSDKGARGEREDASGVLMASLVRETLPLCHERGFILPDDPQALRGLVMELALGQGYDLILTSGGTGLAPRDTTPEALLPLLERRLSGVEQAMMQTSLTKTPTAMLSRAVCGTLGATLVLTLPGSVKAVRENLTAVLPALGHGLEKLHGDPTDCGEFLLVTQGRLR